MMSKLNKTQIVICGLPIWVESTDEDEAKGVEIMLSDILDKHTAGWSHTEPKQTEPTPSIPPGWREMVKGDKVTHDDYSYTDGIWKRQVAMAGYVTLREGTHPFITQIIDIDLDRQPEEFVGWAQDDCGSWYSFQEIPKYNGAIWTSHADTARQFVDSEHPDWIGHAKDSLLVRPQAWNNRDVSRGEEE